MSENIISIPVLFDIGGDAIVFGEETPDDFVTSHLDFVLDMTTEANDISLNAADISAAILIGDNDTNDNIFYSGGTAGNVAVDNLCNRIAKAITRGKLVHLPKSGDHSNSGIPMGGRQQLANNLGELGTSYATKYMTSIAPIGDEQMLGQAMARVASVHLVGSPLAAGIFQDKNQIQTDLETASAQTFNDGNTAFYNALAVQLSKVLGGSKSSAPMNNGSGSGSSGGGSSGGGGSTPDLASQVLYENFEDQAYEGTTTTADVVSGGYNSSSYALSVPGTGSNSKRWKLSPAIVGGDINNMRVISFWYNPNLASGGSQVHVVVDFRPSPGGTQQGVQLDHEGRAERGEYEKIYVSGNKYEKVYINGVSVGTTDGSKIWTTSTYTSGQWHHILIELKSNHGLANAILLNSGHIHDGRFQCAGKIDDVRIFNAPLSTSQIADLAAGNNGSGGTPTPYDIASSNSTLSGQIYTASTTATHGGVTYTPDRAFNGDSTGANTWISQSNYSGTYNGSESTSGYTGEWIQVDIGHTVVLTSYSFKNNGLGNNNYDIKKMRFFSSNDGTNWTQVKDWDNLTVTDWDSTVGPYTPTTTITGRFFRLAVNELQNTAGLYTELSLFDLQGYATSPTPIDIASVNSTLSGQVYSSSSNLSTDYDATGAFNSDTTGYNAWATESGKYSGTYNGSESTSGYTGEWIQVDIGQSVVLTSYSFKTKDNVNDDYDVKKMRLFSSNDGTNWTQIQDWTNLTAADWATGNTVGPYNAPANTTGRYFRLAINELQATAGVYGVIAVFDLNGYVNPGGSSGGSSGYPFDASGTSVPALKSIYEQLMNVPGRSQIMETRDVSGVVDNSNVTLAGGFPFISGDKLVMYLRPKVVFANQTKPQQNTTLVTASGPVSTTIDVPTYDIGRKSSAGGAISGQVYTESSSHADSATWGFHKCFEGDHTDDEDWTTAGDGNHIYENGSYRYIGDQVTKNIGETKNITVTTAKIQNNNQLVDTEDIFIYGMGFIHYLNLQVGDTVTYEHPTLGSQTTTISAVHTGGVTSVPYMILLTDPHNVNLGVTVSSCTFHNKKEGLAGEWGQVDIGQNTVINKFQIWPRPSYRSSRSPADFSLLGSLDGTNWNFIKSVSGLVASDWATNNGNTPAGTNTWELDTVHGPYRYYRLQVQKTVAYGDARLALTGLLLYGAKSPSEVTTGSTGSVSDISGLVTNIVATGQDISSAFPGKSNGGNSPEAQRWGWMGSPNSDTLSLETTDVKDETICDLHIWKITITL